MLRVDAKQGAPRDGNSPLELFQVTSFLGFLSGGLSFAYFELPHCSLTKRYAALSFSNVMFPYNTIVPYHKIQRRGGTSNLFLIPQIPA